MTTNLLQRGWADLDPAELRFILLERIGKPGQYDGRDSNPNTFYLPLAGSSCRIKLTFSETKQIVAIEPGPAFDAAQWQQVVGEIDRVGLYKVGRDCSFSSFRVAGSWRGKRSGVQILPPPADAPRITIHRTDYRSPMSTGSPTRMKKRAKACERCSRYGGRSRSRGWALF